ncbi:MAG: bifunctional phosphopantothenoylcysteine decarboxylase/phosphopantothenate--cysteine ligase CoaBC [Bacteroidota bacterium]|jgi:phosphopantothenoylcysteine decarboxylase/phosphopantothenate--cysteine ligase
MKGKKILLGVTGSIAAYKSATLIRLLVKAGAEVRVIMTPSAKDFITPLTLSVVSKNPVGCEYFNPADGSWNNHVDLGCWADLLLIAPLSASTLSKMAHGNCDNLLMAVYLSARCPVMIAPAMDLDMWKHFTTQNNLELLIKNGVRVILPATGELASGLVGEGRMEEPENIFNTVDSFFVNGLSLSGIKVLVSTGPTYEAIDPVRYIGNRSSGKMGFALAEELASRGAEVELVTGPTALQTMHPKINTIHVESAQEMHDACMKRFDEKKLVIMSAAVADFKPLAPADQKIKKKSASLAIELTPTPDILAAMGTKKSAQQVLVGFALETEHETENALDKLKRKNLNHIVLNSLNDVGAGFGKDTNKVTVFSANGERNDFDTQSKKEIARHLVDLISTSI